MDVSIKLEGFEELEKALREVPQALKYNIVMETLVKAGRLIVAEKGSAPISNRKKFNLQRRHFTRRKGVHNITTKKGAGELRRSFGIVKSKRSKTPLLWAGPRYGLVNADAWYLHFPEFGTKQRKTDRGINRGSVPAQGYMQKIWNRKEQQVTFAIQNGVFDIIDKHLTKHGWTGKL